MHPCFTFCRILGIFPYKISGSIFEVSELCYVVSTIVICIYCIYGTVVFYQLDISGTITFINVPRSLERHSFYALGSFIAIVTYFLRDPRLLLLQTVLDVSSKLPSESYRRLSKLIHAKDIFGFLFIITLTLVCLIRLDLNSFLLTMFAMYLSLLMFQMEMLYMNCVCVLKVCFKKINDSLTRVQELVINDEPHLLRRTYHERRNSFLLTRLKALKRQHLLVSDTVQMLNALFSLQIIGTIIMSFSEITFSLYFYIVLLMADEKEEFWKAMFVVCMIYFTIKILLIVWACDSGKDQAAKIGITVHSLLNSTNDKQIKDEVLKPNLYILTHLINIFL